MKNYKAFLVDKTTHAVVLSIQFKADGYLTALQEARRLCEKNHDNLYVSQVVAE